jgi:hypothetical protein
MRNGDEERANRFASPVIITLFHHPFSSPSLITSTWRQLLV